MSPSSSLLPTRRPASGLILLLTAAFLPGAMALGEEGKPAKKDSRPAAQPKEVTFSTKVVPATAKPGDKVKLQVTAKLDFHWHIFKYNKTQAADGPRLTTFDFYQTAGLKPLGDWTPSSEPIQKKEPAFPDIPFLEFHEDEVTWTLDLQVPADATPGKKALKVQAGYQICSDQSCSFPGQWTLPAAELTVTGGGGLNQQAAAFYSLTTVGFQAPDAPKPKKKDSRPAVRPKSANFATSIVPADAKPGDTVTFRVAVKLDPGSHIFPNFKNQPEEEGPTNTVFDLFDPSGLTPAGEWSASVPPIEGNVPGFTEKIKFHEGEVVWTLPLKIPADAAAGTKSVQVQAKYQVCNDKVCSVPGQWTLPPAKLNVVGATAVASAGPAPAPEKPAGTPAPEKTAAAPEKPAAVAAPAPAEAKGEKAAATTAALSEVEKQAQQSIWGFLLVCAGGGLLALVMPCVWPMVPITVNFFVKQGQSQKGGTTGLAIAYSMAIIGIFTLVGLLFSIFFGASSLAKLANNPWLNFGVAGLFIVFGLSLLGLFEIRLPNFLLNASAQGESRGGLVGVMFMALTLTITSFTCTFPVVGGLLVMAAGGSYLYPTIGLATFASVIAAPFFLLALAPGLLSKMPKSGDWMNAVKMVGGLVEIGAAFKFLNTAEVAFVVAEDAIFNAEVVLTVWVILAAICGIYLLGLFRTDHDHGEVKVGPGRIVMGSLFLFLALYLAPALFGNPPKGFLYNRLVVGILPADAGRLRSVAMASGGESHEVAATSTNPEEAARQERRFHGVVWGLSYEKALEDAKKEGKPVLIDFTGVNCANCRLMEQSVMPRPEIVQELKKFVTVQLYTDFVQINSISAQDREKLGEKNLDLQLALKVEPSNPSYVILTPEGQVVRVAGGARPAAEFQQFLKDGFKAASPAKSDMAAVESK